VAKNVETDAAPRGATVYLEPLPGAASSAVAPSGHPEGELARAIQLLARPEPRDEDVADGVVFQMTQIDYFTAAPAPRLPPLPRWVGELRADPLRDGDAPVEPPLVPVIRVFGCTAGGLSVEARVHGFEPYLRALLPDELARRIELIDLRLVRARLDRLARATPAGLSALSRPPPAKRAAPEPTPVVVRVEVADASPLRGLSERPSRFLRVSTCLPRHVPIVRSVLERADSVIDGAPPLECFEADVPFPVRYMVDRGFCGCDWLRAPRGQWIRERHDRGAPLARERGGYCARRELAEARLRGDGGDGDPAFVLRDVWPDWGDPAGRVPERGPAGRCAPPGLDRAARWDELREAVPRLAPCERSRCAVEVDVEPGGLAPLGSEGEWARHAPLRVLSFDTEWIGKGRAFPEQGADPVVCACLACLTEAEQGAPASWRRVALQLWECAPVYGASATLWFDDEKTLLMAFRDLCVAFDPDILTGYNTNNFDWPFLISRAETLGARLRFSDMSRVRSEVARVRPRQGASFSTKATARSVDDVVVPGAVVYDMCVAILSNTNYKLSRYTLNAVSEAFLGERKLDVGHDQLPALQRGGPEDRARIAAYCLRDAELPPKLMAKLLELTTGVEMARVTGVPLDYLLTRGQSIRVSRLLYAECGARAVAVQSSKPRSVSEMQAKYEGATVLEPMRGYTDYPIACLDFQALYPSIMMAHNLCVRKATLVTLSSGLAVPVETLPVAGGSRVLGYSSPRDKLVSSAQTLLIDQGRAPVIALTLTDGRELACTADHRIAVKRGSEVTWIPARDVVLNEDDVLVGPEGVRDVPMPDEAGFTMDLGPIGKLEMNPVDGSRTKILAFWRVVGHLLGNGTIAASDTAACGMCGVISLDSRLDYDLLCEDLKLLDIAEPVLQEYAEPAPYQTSTSLRCSVPSCFMKAVSALDGIVVGRRSTQPMSLPAAILDDRCPVAVVREFLAGLFGADGHAPALDRSLRQRSQIAGVQFTRVVQAEHLDSGRMIFDRLIALLRKVGVSEAMATYAYPLARGPVMQNLVDTHPDGLCATAVTMRLVIDPGPSYARFVGFRHSVHKSLRLAAATSFWNYRANILSQTKEIADAAITIWNSGREQGLLIPNGHAHSGFRLAKSKISQVRATKLAIKAVRRPLMHVWISETLKRTAKSQRLQHRAYTSLKHELPTDPLDATEYLRRAGALSWFQRERDAEGHRLVYAVAKDAVGLPTFTLRAIDRRSAGTEPVQVYDLSVDDAHSFLAEGVLVHNCYSTILSDEQRRRFHPDNFEVAPSGFAFARAPKTFDPAQLEGLGLRAGEHFLRDFDPKRAYLKTPGKIPLAAAGALGLAEAADYVPAGDDAVLTGERRYGILPRILSRLLAARGAAKKLMAAAKDPAARSVYNCRQLTLKVTANAVYGNTGAQVGRLSEARVASTVTAYGRDRIELTKQVVEERHGGVVHYGDSVAGHTPVLVLFADDERERYVRMRDLRGDYAPYRGGDKEAFEPMPPICVWSDFGWTAVRRVIRHARPGDLPMVRVVTRTGCVDVTEDHSLLSAEHAHARVSPLDLIAGQTRVLHSDLPPGDPAERVDADARFSSADELALANFFLSAARSGRRPFVESARSVRPLAARERFTLSTGEICAAEADEDVVIARTRVRASPPQSAERERERVYVYDLETENHRFSAGFGRIVVHNTDSVMADFGDRLPVGADVLPFVLSAAVPLIARGDAGEMSACEAAAMELAERAYSPASGFARASDRDSVRPEFMEHAAAYAGAVVARAMELATAEAGGADGVVASAVARGEAGIRAALVEATRAAAEEDCRARTLMSAEVVCDEVTRMLPPPSQLEPEKVLVRWLLISKKRYAYIKWMGGVLDDRITYMGLETKRRDSCPIVKTTIDATLEQVMRRDDLAGGVARALAAVRRVRALECSLDELIITAAYSREEADYLGKQKHTEVVKKMRARGESTAPRIGDRVAYVMVAGPKGAKGFERAEDPVYVLKHGCPIDAEYYVENQLRKPLARILGALVPDPSVLFDPRATVADVLAGAAPKQQRALPAPPAPAPPRPQLRLRRGRPAPSAAPGTLGRFGLVCLGQPCMCCGVSVPTEGMPQAPALCSCCRGVAGVEGELRAQADAELRARREALQAAEAKCAECRRKSAVAEVETCENSECSQLYVRRRAETDVGIAERDVARFGILVARK